MGRVIVANLDYEDSGAKARVRAAVSAAGTLLSVFARDGDRLWTPVPVDPGRVPNLRVRLESGRPIAAAECVLAWAESDEVAAVRRDRSASADGDWRERLWDTQPPDPAVVTRVNHRRFAHELGLGLPEARWIGDASELVATDDAWVCKAPMSASGRGQLRRYVRAVDEAARTRARRLITRHGELLYEPWVERVEDFGFAGMIDDNGCELLGAHRQLVDRQGVFKGIELDPELDIPALTEAADTAARALAAAGYRGPFGIDAYSYRDSSGTERFNPMSEINARLTFGHVARAFDQLRLRLRLTVTEEALPESATVLLRPATDEPTAAWLELP